MKHLSHFEVRSFRNVRPTKLEFRAGLNVVLGKNAAGKTTLLQLLTDSLAGTTENQEERSVVSTTEDGVRRLLQEQRVERLDSPVPGVAPELVERTRFEYRGAEQEFVANSDGGGLTFPEWKGVALKPSRHEFTPQMRPLFRLLIALSGEVELQQSILRLGFTLIERFDESLEYYGRLLSFEQTRREGMLNRVLSRGLPPSLVLGNSMEEPIRGAFEAPFLNRAAEAMGYRTATASFLVDRRGDETRMHQPTFSFHDGNDRFTHSSLSFGEKRLLAFFALSEGCPDILIADELVNGLHHEWIRKCLKEVGERQAILTSQNPLLLDYIEFDDPADFQRGIVLCERAPVVNGATELVWRNPTADEATEFFAAYETGLQSVSEILISKGFW